MLKRFSIKIYIFGVIAVLFSTALFAGCGSMKGSFCTLDELYENEVITREDIMNIAALRTGSVQIIIDPAKADWEYENVEFAAAEPDPPLSNTLKKTIEKDFKTAKGRKFTSFEMRYYGTYADHVIVEIGYSVKDVQTTAAIRQIAVSDIYLGTISAQSEIVAWREKTN